MSVMKEAELKATAHNKMKIISILVGERVRACVCVCVCVCERERESERTQ